MYQEVEWDARAAFYANHPHHGKTSLAVLRSPHLAAYWAAEKAAWAAGPLSFNELRELVPRTEYWPDAKLAMVLRVAEKVGSLQIVLAAVAGIEDEPGLLLVLGFDPDGQEDIVPVARLVSMGYRERVAATGMSVFDRFRIRAEYVPGFRERLYRASPPPVDLDGLLGLFDPAISSNVIAEALRIDVRSAWGRESARHPYAADPVSGGNQWERFSLPEGDAKSFFERAVTGMLHPVTKELIPPHSYAAP